MSLLEKLKDIGSPDPSTAGIDERKIINNAAVVNNGPKHDRTIPDPIKYKDVLSEVRKIIRCYIDQDAELELIDDSLYGDGKAWYELLEDTSEFNSAYSYVLITRRVGTINLKGLFSLKWDLVIDMDPDSDTDGLASSYMNVTGLTPRVRTLDASNARKSFLYRRSPIG